MLTELTKLTQAVWLSYACTVLMILLTIQTIILIFLGKCRIPSKTIYLSLQYKMALLMICLDMQFHQTLQKNTINHHTASINKNSQIARWQSNHRKAIITKHVLLCKILREVHHTAWLIIHQVFCCRKLAMVHHRLRHTMMTQYTWNNSVVLLHCKWMSNWYLRRNHMARKISSICSRQF